MAIVRMIDLLDDFLAHWKEREKKDPTIKLGDDERIGATLFAQWYDLHYDQQADDAATDQQET